MSPLPISHSPIQKMPTWLHAVTFVLVSLFLFLSYWQAQRGFQKQDYVNNISSQIDSQPLDNSQITQASVSSLQGKPVVLHGEFDNEHFFLIENKIVDQELGFAVIQAFTLDQSTTLLVNRGWIPKPADSQKPITIAPIAKPATITGQLYRPKHNVFIRNNRVTDTWPHRALEIDLGDFEHCLDQELFPMVVNLHDSSDFSFVGPPPLQQAMQPERHFGYSFQWLLFAVILLAIWGHRLIRTRRHHHESNTI